MSINHFSKDQMKEFQYNPYVDKVSSKAVTYSEEFKNLFLVEYSKGKLPTQIFIEAGFDPSVLGRDRIANFSKRIRKMGNRPEGVMDLRGQNSGRPREKDRTKNEEIAYLRHQVALQKQQIEALKKTNSINRKAAKTIAKRNSN